MCVNLYKTVPIIFTVSTMHYNITFHEQTGWSDQQTLWLPRPMGGLYTTELLYLFTRSCDLLEKYRHCPLMESDCT